MCLLCLVQLPQAGTLNRALVHMNAHSTRNRNTPAWNSVPCIYRAKPLPVDTALPSFSSERTVVWLHHPQAPSKRWGVGGGHAYRCCASSQHTNHDDNHNDDNDSEECCLTERLTLDSSLESNIAPEWRWEQFICYYLWIITFHSFAKHQWTHSIQRAIVWGIYSVCSGAFDVAL